MIFQWSRTRLLIAALAAVLAISACREAPPVLKVGCQGDRAFRMALDIAISRIEQSGSPVRLEVVYDETRGWTPAKVVRSSEAFCNDPDILAVIGFSSSDSSLAAARMFNRRGIPQVIPTATSPKLLETGPWTFKLCPNDTHQAEFLAAAAWNRLGARRCAVVYQNSDYGRGLSDLFQEEFELMGGEVTLSYLLGSGYTKPAQVELYVQLIKEKQPDLLVLICQPPQAHKVREELLRQGCAIPLLGSDSMGTYKVRGELAGAFEGMPLALFYHPDIPHPGNTAFAEQFRSKWAAPPGYEAALAHDALLLLHQAVLEGARSREEIRDHLARLSGDQPPFPGVAGPILFNPAREVERPLHLGILREGELALHPPGEPGAGKDSR